MADFGAPEPHRPHLPASSRRLMGAHLLHLAARELNAHLDREFAPLDLTGQQAGLLLRLVPGALSPRQLAPVLGTDHAGMTRLVDRVAGKGLVARQPHPQDRRSIVVGLTDAGLEVARLLPPVFARVSTRLFAGFTDEETELATGLLGRMLGSLRDTNE